jgi:hypothetical protein
MKAKVRILLERCIEYGTERGYRRAFKHTDSPSEAHIISEIDAAIWLEIDTYCPRRPGPTRARNRRLSNILSQGDSS